MNNTEIILKEIIELKSRNLIMQISIVVLLTLIIIILLLCNFIIRRKRNI